MAGIALSGCQVSPNDVYLQAKANVTSSEELALSEGRQTNQIKFDLVELEALYKDEAFTAVPMVKDDLFTLAEHQIQHFKDYYYSDANANTREHHRFANYLESAVSGFSYLGDTYTADQAFAQSAGNCLSLAILTTALADIAGLEITYQKVDSRPVFSKHGNILLLSSHVRTKVYEPKKEQAKNVVVFGRASMIIDYFPSAGDVNGQTVPINDFIAMYYQNKVAEALIDGRLDKAYQLVKTGLTYNPAHPETLNLLGVLYKRKGLLKDAETVFETMMAYNLSSLNAIENYASLLERNQQPHKAGQLMERLDGVTDYNPYRWLSLAQSHLEQENYRLALKYAEKASELAAYLHEPHFLKSKIYLKQLKKGASLASMRTATRLAATSEQRMQYLAKLIVLKTEH